MPPLNPLQKKCLALAISQSLISTAQAATIQVNNDGDAGVGCTLREAITSFNAQTLAGGCTVSSGTLAEPGTITFAPALANSTVTLNGTQLDVNNNADISIDGAGVTIDGSFQSRLLNVSYATLSIDSMTLTRGGTIQGGEQDPGTLLLRDSSITLSNCNITNNRGAYYEALIDSRRSAITVNNSNISNNVSTDHLVESDDGGDITFDRVIIDANSTDFYLISASDNERISISNTTISNNTANAFSFINFRRNDSTEIINSTVSNNTSRYFTLRPNQNPTTIANSTISGNSITSTSSNTSVISITNASVSLINATVTNNIAPTSIRVATNPSYSGPISVNLVNSIVANTIGGIACRVSTSSSSTATLDDITSDSHSIIDDGSCQTQGRNLDPLVAPLANNGGLTMTHALLSTSPAINTGNNATCAATDQRGEARPLSEDNQCDVGAFERQASDTDSDTTTFVIPLPDGKAVIFDL